MGDELLALIGWGLNAFKHKSGCGRQVGGATVKWTNSVIWSTKVPKHLRNSRHRCATLVEFLEEFNKCK